MGLDCSKLGASKASENDEESFFQQEEVEDDYNPQMEKNEQLSIQQSKVKEKFLKTKLGRQRLRHEAKAEYDQLYQRTKGAESRTSSVNYVRPTVVFHTQQKPRTAKGTTYVFQENEALPQLALQSYGFQRGSGCRSTAGVRAEKARPSRHD